MVTFTRFRRQGPTGTIRGEWIADARYGALPDVAQHLKRLASAGEVLKRDPTHEVLVVELQPRAMRLLCKFFPEHTVGDRIRQRWALDRPARMHRRLRRAASLALPLPISLGHVSVAGVGAAWFCPLLPGKSLLHWTGENLPATPEGRAALLLPVVKTMDTLHAAGYVHGDFKWGNVLREGDTCWLVDVDGVRAVAPTGFCRGKARDLARFLLDCEEAGVPSPEVHALLQHYAELASFSREAVETRVNPILSRLRERHRRRYGEGFRLTLYGPDSSAS